MTRQDQLRTLTEVEALFADPTRWCRGHMRRTRDPTEPARYCLVGAWMHLAPWYGEPGGDSYEELQQRDRAIGEVSRLLGVRSAVEVNDLGGYRVVMVMLRDARNRLERELRTQRAAGVVS